MLTKLCKSVYIASETVVSKAQVQLCPHKDNQVSVVSDKTRVDEAQRGNESGFNRWNIANVIK